ncbi:uncharacterized protein BCR38DRAFT_133775 [Pseudomassariella vexata]|uniref:Uncharacterized protein n=1 Tax=Pseudomassariella vexata TaxID=1141098 RepID=A0A1Y2EAE9_9PEZI|nr:uncharacterized protein BCR38DRAFT_133775 [Pseudomassariella vexata]ORY68512.1 hypothetical protein BCR38DRAFT_133775 [Pseudomassariella vexata]
MLHSNTWSISLHWPNVVGNKHLQSANPVGRVQHCGTQAFDATLPKPWQLKRANQRVFVHQRASLSENGHAGLTTSKGSAVDAISAKVFYTGLGSHLVLATFSFGSSAIANTMILCFLSAYLAGYVRDRNSRDVAVEGRRRRGRVLRCLLVWRDSWQHVRN